MEKDTTSPKKHCFNCGAPIQGAFCHECGQRVRDNLDRSLKRLLGEFFGNVFFFDNRFFLSVWYLIRFPGRMTVEFLAGKRKKFISPVTLYLFFNLVFFIVNPLTDYSVSLYDQMNTQPYSPLIKEWAAQKIKEKGRTPQTYRMTYQNASDNISKSIMILNIPIIALFVYLIAFKRRPFYFDSLIFGFNFFSFFMFSWIVADWVGELTDFFTGDPNTILSAIVFILFTFFSPLYFAIPGIKRLMNIKWYWAVLAGSVITFSVFFTNLFYRLIVLVVTLWFS